MKNILILSHVAVELNPAPDVALQQNHESQLLIKSVEMSEPLACR